MIVNNPLINMNITSVIEDSKLRQRADGSLLEITEKDLEGVTTIEDYAFYYADALQKATIPASVTMIKKGAFAQSTNFNTLILNGNSVKTLENTNALNNTVIKNVLETNWATSATYKCNSWCNGSTNAASYGEANWTSYHSGRLNNGTIGSGASADNSQFIEFGNESFVGANIYMYFKLSEKINVNQVKLYMHQRSANIRGFPSSINVWVGTAEDHITSQYKLGTASYTSATDQRNYTISGSKSGNYIIIQFTTTNSAAVLGISEVQIFGSKSTDTAGIYIENESLVSSYKTATNWSYYAELIKPISKYSG